MTITGMTQPPLFPVSIKTTIPVQEAKLDNGARVYLIEAGTEDIMRMEFVFRAGIVNDYIPLVASSANMMLTEGTANYTAEALNSKLDYYGIFLNLGCDRDTAGLTVYFLSRHFTKVLDLASEILFKPAFYEKELDLLMKKRLSWYLVGREKVQNLAMDRFFESVFGPHHPYGRQVHEEDFGNITPAVLKDFHTKFYTPETMAVIISGRIHSNAVDLLEKTFGGLHSKKIFIEENPAVLKGSARMKVHLKKPGAVQTAIRIGSSTINIRHPDYPGLKFLNVVLGGYFGSRLMKNIREKNGYTYGIHSRVSSFDQSGFKVISTEVGNQYRKAAAQEIYREIMKLRAEPVPPEEMEVVRNFMSGEMVRMFDGPFALAESFKSIWEFGLDDNYYTKFAELIKTITPEELMRLAEKYYNTDDLYEITAG
ncbi:MAG: pitrilysin family protein [Bacteroidales bacterium]